jgi:hypothetical protein
MCDQLISNGLDQSGLNEAGQPVRVKALAHAAVDVTNLDEIREAITLFGFIAFGVNLEDAQQAQSNATPPVWSYSQSGDWGGHAVLGAGFNGYDFTDVSWAMLVTMLQSFAAHQLEEARVIIWPEHLGLNAFVQGVDLQHLAADYKELTGRDFPVSPTDPTPAPAAASITPLAESEPDVDSLLDQVRRAMTSGDAALKADVKNLLEQIKSDINAFVSSHGL